MDLNEIWSIYQYIFGLGYIFNETLNYFLMFYGVSWPSSEYTLLLLPMTILHTQRNYLITYAFGYLTSALSDLFDVNVLMHLKLIWRLLSEFKSKRISSWDIFTKGYEPTQYGTKAKLVTPIGLQTNKSSACA